MLDGVSWKETNPLILESPDAANIDYQVTLRKKLQHPTTKTKGADLYVIIIGADGQTKKIPLDKEENDTEFKTKDVGTVSCVQA